MPIIEIATVSQYYSRALLFTRGTKYEWKKKNITNKLNQNIVEIVGAFETNAIRPTDSQISVRSHVCKSQYALPHGHNVHHSAANNMSCALTDLHAHSSSSSSSMPQPEPPPPPLQQQHLCLWLTCFVCLCSVFNTMQYHVLHSASWNSRSARGVW